MRVIRDAQAFSALRSSKTCLLYRLTPTGFSLIFLEHRFGIANTGPLIFLLRLGIINAGHFDKLSDCIASALSLHHGRTSRASLLASIHRLVDSSKKITASPNHQITDSSIHRLVKKSPFSFLLSQLLFVYL